jgi:hypothetical protein
MYSMFLIRVCDWSPDVDLAQLLMEYRQDQSHFFPLDSSCSVRPLGYVVGAVKLPFANCMKAMHEFISIQMESKLEVHRV